jgi:hypothetical protein
LGTSQASHWPSQELVQQTPSTQNPLWQPRPSLQEAPSSPRKKQAPPSQKAPGAQSASAAQEELQAPASQPKAWHETLEEGLQVPEPSQAKEATRTPWTSETQVGAWQGVPGA